MAKLSITQWAEADRPREKLRDNGAAALTDAELLAIIIGSGSAEESAVELMKRVMAACNNNLNTLGKLTIRDLCQFKGIGEAKAISILAACELGKRRQREHAEERPALDTPQALYEHMHTIMQDSPTEQAWLLMLNNRNRLLRAMQLSSGGLSETAIDVRVVLKEALLQGATAIALAHNHPSGNARPSREDDNITKRINEASAIMRIRLLDHIIVCDGSYYSYAEHGRL